MFIVYKWPRSRSRPKHRCQTRCSADSWIDCSKWNQNSRAKILEPKSKKEMIKASISIFWSISMNKSFSTDLEPLLNPRSPRLLLHILARATAPLQASEAVLPTYQSQRLDHFHPGLTFVKLRNLQNSSKIIENYQSCNTVTIPCEIVLWTR